MNLRCAFFDYHGSEEKAVGVIFDRKNLKIRIFRVNYRTYCAEIVIIISEWWKGRMF